MAKYQSGILGAFSGKVGKIVGSSWRGIDYIRSLATHVANPRTAQQVAVRSLLSATTQSIKPFLYAIRLGFVGRKGLSSWNLAVAANRRVIEDNAGDTTNWNFDPTKLILTNGSEPFSASLTAGRDNDYNVQWTPADIDSRLYGAQVYVVLYNENTKQAETYHADISTGSLSIQTSAIRQQDTDKLHAYSFAASNAVSSVMNYHAIA